MKITEGTFPEMLSSPLRRKDVVKRSATTIFAATALLCFLSVYLIFSPEHRQAITDIAKSLSPNNRGTTLRFRLLAEIYDDMKIPITQPSFTASNGKNYVIEGEPAWTTGLGKQVLILDADTRALGAEGELLHDESFMWNDTKATTAGLLNHYIYAQIHGYDYKLVRPVTSPKRFPSWLKPSVLTEALKTYRFVVFADSDAIWHHPEVPLEWLFNHWNITASTSLAMSGDPIKYPDSHGRQGVNTGFVIAQRNERTLQILDAWDHCAEIYPGCAEWNFKKAYDQAAFNEYIRYTYNEPDDVKELSCDETDGYPRPGLGCDGVFIRHFWYVKGLTKPAVEELLIDALMQRVHAHFMEHKGELVQDDVSPHDDDLEIKP